MAVDHVLERLLAAVIADPADDGPRLAYADRLEEAGGDDARAEFIRVQCELARLDPGPEDRRRASNLLARHRKGAPVRMTARTPATLLMREHLLLVAHEGDWSPPEFTSGPPIRHWGWRRGFVDEVRLPCDAWLSHGPALARAAPLTRVRLTDRTPNPADGGHTSRYYWWHGDLPAGVYRLMACDDAQPAAPRERPNWKRYPDLAAAGSAASAALLAWARAAAPEAAAPEAAAP
jgi:uncharacterized protein (TIGR02996 family)